MIQSVPLSKHSPSLITAKEIIAVGSEIDTKRLKAGAS